MAALCTTTTSRWEKEECDKNGQTCMWPCGRGNRPGCLGLGDSTADPLPAYMIGTFKLICSLGYRDAMVAANC